VIDSYCSVDSSNVVLFVHLKNTAIRGMSIKEKRTPLNERIVLKEFPLLEIIQISFMFVVTKYGSSPYSLQVNRHK
jgi:hypothetical protein